MFYCVRNFSGLTYIVSLFVCLFFFFKQKTAYEMRISDWSSDVCSSDLFGDDDLDVVVAAVDAAASNSDWIAEARSALRRASPTSLRATWRRVVEGRGRSVERILADDHQIGRAHV